MAELPASDARATGVAATIEHLQVLTAADDVLLEDLSLTLTQGRITALVGESGSGKTLTGRALLRLIDPELHVSGTVTVTGFGDVAAASRRELEELRGAGVGLVFQEPQSALSPSLTVGGHLRLARRAGAKTGRVGAGRRGAARHTESRHAEDRPADDRRAGDWRLAAAAALREVGLAEPDRFIDSYPHQLSGGQKQRVVLALALARDPLVLVADEPTTALDVTVQAEILRLLRRIADERGVAILLVSHSMGVVAQLADEVVVLRRGKVVEAGTVLQIFQRPEQEYTRTLLASVLSLPAGAGAGAAAGTAAAGGSEAGPADRTKAPAPILSLQQVSFSYSRRSGRRGAGDGAPAVGGVDLEVGAGEVLGLVGESGSGKSTIGRLALGRLTPTAGTVSISARRIAFVPQDPYASFNPRWTVGQSISEPLRIGREGGATPLPAAIAEALESVQLPAAFAARRIQQLSGGQRQRVALARALITHPDFILADEPTSALDVSVQEVVLRLWETLREEYGFASVFITHDLAVAARVSDRIAVLYAGRVVEQGSVEDVLLSPQAAYTKRLIASVPQADPTTRERALS